MQNSQDFPWSEVGDAVQEVCQTVGTLQGSDGHETLLAEPSGQKMNNWKMSGRLIKSLRYKKPVDIKKKLDFAHLL